jgi:DNA-binding HxlR family transcriptional regulator
MTGRSPRTPSETPTRPIMALLAILERRWTLRVIWELRAGRLTSRELRRACGDLSPTVLQARVDELKAADLVDLKTGGYALTPLGRELSSAFAPLYAFAARWGDRAALSEPAD